MIDTSTADSIRRAADKILLSEPQERLRHIAGEGKSFILETFGIEKIAGRFADFYAHVYGQTASGTISLSDQREGSLK